jgi:uncharacterized protein (TIGR02452 family)
MKSQTKRIETANLTLQILKEGKYQVANKTINVREEIQNCIEKTYTIAPQDWNTILSDATNKQANLDFTTNIELWNCSTIEAIIKANKGLKTGVLNFASAKNPGGGFLGGASAQEESLARSSSLYASQTKSDAMYKYNRGQTDFLYSDYMIYSPDVVFWFDDEGNSIENPPKIDIITSPAPNKGAMLQHERNSEIRAIEEVFKARIEKVLALAVANNLESIILGAWGCGVFRNEPSDVAQYFKDVIAAKFKNSFKEIIFAIYDTSAKKQNFLAFEEVLLG